MNEKRILIRKLASFLLFPLALSLMLAGSCAQSPKPASARRDEAPSVYADREEGDRFAEMSMGAGEGLAKAEAAAFAPEPEPEMKSKDGEASPGSEPAAPRPALTLDEGLRVKPPRLLARIEGTELEKLETLAYEATILVAGHTARVILDMSFANRSEKRLSGTLYIDLPDGASPSSLVSFAGAPSIDQLDQLSLLPGSIPLAEVLLEGGASKIDFSDAFGEPMEARIVEPVKARQTYEKVVRARVDPALAEWSGGNSFSTRIFPIAPRSVKRVLFSYDRPVPMSGDEYLLPLPLPSEIEGITRVTTFALGGAFKNARMEAGGREIAKLAEMKEGFRFEPEKDFKGALAFRASPSDLRVRSLAGSHPEVPGTLVRAKLKPDLPPGGALRETGRAVFVLDTSYSAKDSFTRLSLKAMKAVLEADPSIRDFAVIAFDAKARLLTEGFVANDKKGRDGFFSALGTVWLEGATNFKDALALLSANETLSSANSFFLLSDGMITWGPENPERLVSAFPELEGKFWICYRFGEEASNKALFDRLTRDGGMTVSLAPGEDIASAAAAHTRPRYEISSIRTEDGVELEAAGDSWSISAGESLDLAIRAPEGLGIAHVFLKIEGKDYPFEVPLGTDPIASGLAARSWAELRVAKLLALGTDEADRAALALSQAFSLANRAASLMILEDESEYVKYNIEKETLDLAAIRKAAKGEAMRVSSGEPSDSGLDEEAIKTIRAMEELQGTCGWLVPVKRVSREGKGFLSLKAPARKNDYPESIYRSVQGIESGAIAFRTLTTIVELAPKDDTAVRLTGYALLSLGMYEEAAELFAGSRARRPFEPQNYLLEAVALQAVGRPGKAALRYEIILAEEWDRFDSYAKSVATRLYRELLDEAASALAGAQGKAVVERRKSLPDPIPFDGRLILFWNLDDTDVDLHVKEPNGFEIYYEKPKSPSGAELFWDNTEGLGPELFEHPKLPSAGLEVFVDYFGSSSAEGAAPASTLAIAFHPVEGGLAAAFYATLVTGKSEGMVPIIPGRWYRK